MASDALRMAREEWDRIRDLEGASTCGAGYPNVSIAISISENDGRLYACFEDATGFVTGEGGVQGPGDTYPAMVSWEMNSGTMLPDDVRQLGRALILLADNADRLQAMA